MIAETTGKSLDEVRQISASDFQIWDSWFTYKYEQEKKALNDSKKKGKK